MRRAIASHERISVTLRFIATGRSYEDLEFSAAISAESLGVIIPETCPAIFIFTTASFVASGSISDNLTRNC
jgi:hypothetical protein